MAAYSAWGVERKSCKRREVDPPPGTPINDLGRAIYELTTEHHRPWPGNSRQNWERFLEREGIAQGGEKRNEAASRFEIVGGKAA